MPITIQVFIPTNETVATLTAITGSGTPENPYEITRQGDSQFGTIQVDDLANLVGQWQWQVGTRAIGRVTIIAGQTDYPISSGGGGTIDTEQLLADLIEGLSDSVTRIGPEYNAETRTITLIAGDDYLHANGNALTFAVTFPGVDLSAATAVYGGSGDYLDLLNGTAALVDLDTDTPKLRLQWTREQTNKKPSAKYCWGVAIILDGKVQTVVGGNLILKPPLVPISIVDAELA